MNKNGQPNVSLNEPDVDLNEPDVDLNEPDVDLNEPNSQPIVQENLSLNNNFANTSIKPIQVQPVGKKMQRAKMPTPRGKLIKALLNAYNKTKKGKNKYNARRKSMKTIQNEYFENKPPEFKIKRALNTYRRQLPKVRGISVHNKNSRTQKAIAKALDAEKKALDAEKKAKEKKRREAFAAKKAAK
jgi:hypothetical protein